jgi:hypothetical protein
MAIQQSESMATHQNREALAENMRNSVDVIRQHYRKAIPPTLAKEYWSLGSYSLSSSCVISLSAGLNASSCSGQNRLGLS